MFIPVGAHNVLNGSVLGPLLYIIPTSSIGDLSTSFGPLHQLHAVDMQAYAHRSPDDSVAAVDARVWRAMDASI